MMRPLLFAIALCTGTHAAAEAGSALMRVSAVIAHRCTTHAAETTQQLQRQAAAMHSCSHGRTMRVQVDVAGRDVSVPESHAAAGARPDPETLAALRVAPHGASVRWTYLP